MTKKEISLDYLQLCAKGESRKAFRLYVDDSFKHHNAWFKGDADSLMLAMEENAKSNPDKIFEPLHVLEDQHMTCAYSRVRVNKEDRGAAVMHLFKFNGDKIIELWDMGMAVPEKMVNENGMF